MNGSSSYWLRRASGARLSRRRLLGATAAVGGAGALGMALARCGGGSGRKPTPGTSPDNAARQPQRGGTFRWGTGIPAWDTFDADRSRFTPFAFILGYTNLGLAHYKSFEKADLEWAFAQSREWPDDTTLNLTLRQNLYWHDKPPVNGREATVGDIVQFITRNKQAKLRDGTSDNRFYRTGEYEGVEWVRAVDAATVSIRFNRPSPLFETTLAAGYSKIQAPEAVDRFETDYYTPSAEQIIGTGGYVLEKFNPEGSVELRRFEKFYTTPWLDGIKFEPLFTDGAAVQAGFETKQLDTFIPRTTVLADALKAKYAGQIYDTTTYATNPIVGSHYRGAPPWNNENLVGAIMRTIERWALVRELFQGRGVVAANIPPAQSAFGISEKELETMPGYLPDRSLDLAEAKKMWDAGGGPGTGRILIDIPDIFEGASPGITQFILGMLRANLGDAWEAKTEPYSTITEKINRRQYGNGNNNLWFGWGGEVGKLEPALELWNTYNSASKVFPILGGLKLDRVDALTDKLIIESDSGERMNLCQQVERELLKHYGAGIPYLVNAINTSLYWNYYNLSEAASFGTSHQCATQCWFKQDDPTWKGRPA